MGWVPRAPPPSYHTRVTPLVHAEKPSMWGHGTCRDVSCVTTQARSSTPQEFSHRDWTLQRGPKVAHLGVPSGSAWRLWLLLGWAPCSPRVQQSGQKLRMNVRAERLESLSDSFILQMGKLRPSERQHQSREDIFPRRLPSCLPSCRLAPSGTPKSVSSGTSGGC